MDNITYALINKDVAAVTASKTAAEAAQAAAETAAAQAQTYAENAFSTTPEGYEELKSDLANLKALGLYIDADGDVAQHDN